MKAIKLLCALLPAVLPILATSCSDDDDINVKDVPVAVVDAFNKMYPNARSVDWEKTDGYYLAEFFQNTFDSEAWYTKTGTWAMTMTDYNSMVNQLPAEVSTAFVQSEYATWIVDDASYYEKPSGSFCIIEVETDGFPEISLFYDAFGNLINKVQGDNYYITPSTNPSTITF